MQISFFFFSIIAAGFTNGYIGLWHLTTTSSLLLTQRQNTKFIDTFHHFFAHSNAITSKQTYPNKRIEKDSYV